MMAFDPLACKPRRDRLESSEVLPPASAGSESARLGSLNALDELERGMLKKTGYSVADSYWNGKPFNPQTLNGCGNMHSAHFKAGLIF
jgi:hypothetical protein